MGRRNKAENKPPRGGNKGGNKSHRSDKQAARKKRRGEGAGGGCEDFRELADQLRPMGLRVKKMDGDGNCLFRSFADQICGDCEEHQQYRDDCCNMMLDNIEEFELFHAEDEEEEEESFEAYVRSMRDPGRWGSQLELMALCRHHGVNAIVHQSGRPAYEMVFAPREARCIQLSYHDGEHYNSIRFAWDLAAGQPAQFLTLQMLRSNDCAEGAAKADSEEPEDVRLVREMLPPSHAACAAAVRAALARANNDVAQAAEYLLTDEFRGAGAPGLDDDTSSAAAGAGTPAEAGANQHSGEGNGQQAQGLPADAVEASIQSNGAECSPGQPSPEPPSSSPALPASAEPQQQPQQPLQADTAASTTAEASAASAAVAPPSQRAQRRAKDAAGRKSRNARDRPSAAIKRDAVAAEQTPDADAHLSLLARQLLSV